ncbi:MAG TPA: hypothetical protein DDW55_05985 [Gammaproteobacteria bacterium]|nr:hypothetical protein [Gammaproteobacteria bacterium]
MHLTDTLLQHAFQYQQSGNIPAAEDACRQYLEQNPDNPEALHLLGYIYSQSGRLDDGETLLRQCLQQLPEQPHVLNTLGNLLQRKGNRDEAATCYKQSCELDPEFAEAWYNLGRVLNALDRNDEAIEPLQRAIALKSDDHRYHNVLGMTYKAMNRFHEAITSYHRALELDTDDISARHNLGLALRLSGNFKEAISCFRKVLESNSNIAVAHYNLGNALQLMNQIDQAEASYNEALSLRPDFIEAHYDLNQMLWMHGREGRMMQSYSAALQQLPGSLDLWVNYIRALMLNNAMPKAEIVTRDAIRQLGANAVLHNLLATCVSRQGRQDEALEYHHNAAMMDEENTAYLLNYSKTLMMLEEYEGALELLENACKLDPMNQELIAYRADCWRFLGDERYDWLFDYDTMIKFFPLPLPDGYNDRNQYMQDLNHALDAVHSTTRKHPLDQTLRGGSQSYEDLFDKDIKLVQHYKDCLKRAVHVYMEDMEDNPDHPLYSRKSDDFSFSGAFSVRLRSQGFHTNHVHPAGWLSSCCYIALPPDVEDEEKREGWIHFGQPPLALGLPLEPIRYVQPKEGYIAIFPSYMWHGTVPYHSSNTRTTVVSDIVPC